MNCPKLSQTLRSTLELLTIFKHSQVNDTVAIEKKAMTTVGRFAQETI
jgi:hypothetical protein